MSYELNVRYEKEATGSGNRYTFFCGLSDVAVHATGFVCAADEETALSIARQEAQRHFNRCKQCGTWVGDAVFNIDESKCVLCAPFTVTPNYCTECGSPIKTGSDKCTRCGFPVSTA
jgi:hypothetical protein